MPVPGLPALAWVDIETTGLDPAEHIILEVGLIITDRDLHEISRARCVRPIDGARARDWIVDAKVLEMHTKGGLIDECNDAASQFGRTIAPLLAGFDPLPMAGAGVAHFDRPFLRAKFPAFEKLFHYRCVDVSTLRELDRLWAPGDRKILPPKRERHRVFDDLEDSIDCLRAIRTSFDSAHPWTAR